MHSTNGHRSEVAWLSKAEIERSSSFANLQNSPQDRRATVGVLIRFSNSAETLPDVLAALQNQTLQPDVILGVDSGSGDGSRALIQAAGGKVIEWPHRYEHSKVLNFGLKHLHTNLVLVLSSHTVLEDPETLSHMVQAMHDTRTACVSLKWDADPFYSDAIDWRELSAKGLKFGSIYSNSMGMIRRSLWERHPFDETLDTAEDYAWAIHQLDLGHICRRLAQPFHYSRSGHNRDFEFAQIVFRLAQKNRLKVTWLGLRATFKAWLKALFQQDAASSLHRARLLAFCRVLLT
jgi:glycosyltransferase involved in cell wall biosynthesis